MEFIVKCKGKEYLPFPMTVDGTVHMFYVDKVAWDNGEYCPPLTINFLMAEGPVLVKKIVK